MSKYKNGKIYKLVNDTLELTYYGSTISTTNKRLQGHRAFSKNINKNHTSKQLFTQGEVKIYIVENYPCNSKEELLQRERFYIENNICVNKHMPIRYEGETKEYSKQHYIKNRENINEKHKQYYIKNKEKHSEQGKQYRINNKERVNQQQKQYDEKNKDKKKQYYLDNKAKKQQYYIDNKEQIKEKYRHIKTIKHLDYLATLI
tara:strand:- start:2 stop:610 length:609 start_codon:yes stop_codon:yes gene_type:complete